jgi:hypothetical protein
MILKNEMFPEDIIVSAKECLVSADLKEDLARNC